MNRTSIPLDDLPKWSPWPARLLGIDEFHKRERTVRSVTREYDEDKYPPLLSAWRAGEVGSPEEVKQLQLGARSDDNSLCVSFGDALYEMERGDVFERFQDLLYSSLRDEAQRADVVVELGCGYGYNLWRLGHRLDASMIGGELSSNAVELARGLYEDNDALRVEEFNFMTESYPLLELADARVVLFTAHAIEQLPSAEVVVRSLVGHGAQLRAVFHFEPVMELYGDSLLDLMRRRYTELNDYNADLLTQLRSQAGVQIESVEANVLGINPLNPTSIIKWRPSGTPV